jgi:hypothetical protein
VNCDRAQAAISERMDGERLPGRVTTAVDAHLEDCTHCRTFAERASTVRTAVRIRPAERIPDLIDPIMAEVARTRPAGRPVRRRRSARRSWVVAPTAAALAVGLVAGSLVVGGPWRDHRSNTSASAAEVITGVRVAARTVEAYHAVYTITQRGLPDPVPERTLEAELWFSAPGRYRLDVRDRTGYPSDDWTPTDLRYVQAGTAVYRESPTGCPSGLPADECLPTSSGVVTRHDLYSTEAPLAADLVVPLDVLANARGLTVERTGVVMGRPAVLVATSFARAVPMFPFLQMGGVWRPFFDDDRVELWVDTTDWSPLRWSVFPAEDPARADWELRFGLQPEPTDTAIFDVTATETDHDTPARRRFAAAHPADPVPIGLLSKETGFRSVTPTATENLRLTSVAAPLTEGGGGQSLLMYSNGLTYLRVMEQPRWRGGNLFGQVSGDAERVDLGGGIAYYEPADRVQGRRLAIHTDDTNVYLETNLSREELLAVAASLPLDGRAIPASWSVQHVRGARTERISLEEAREEMSFAFDVPRNLPGGYVLASVERTLVGGRDSVTLTVRQRDSDLGAGPIRIHLEAAGALPPAVAADRVTMPLNGADARWTASQGRLEWIAHGVYRSVEGPGLDLRLLTAVAATIEASA